MRCGWDVEGALLLWVAMVTGARRGEMCAALAAVDLDTGVLWVRRSI